MNKKKFVFMMLATAFSLLIQNRSLATECPQLLNHELKLWGMGTSQKPDSCTKKSAGSIYSKGIIDVNYAPDLKQISVSSKTLAGADVRKFIEYNSDCKVERVVVVGLSYGKVEVNQKVCDSVQLSTKTFDGGKVEEVIWKEGADPYGKEYPINGNKDFDYMSLCRQYKGLFNKSQTASAAKSVNQNSENNQDKSGSSAK